MKKTFENHIVLISGALGDIGRAVAKAFAAHGASLALSDIKPHSDATAFLQELREMGVRVHYAQADVSNATAVSAWLDTVESALDTPTVVIANAATVTIAGIEQISAEQWSSEINVNLNGSFFVSQAAAKKMIERQLPGRILFVGSWAGHAVHPNLPAYSVSKAGIRMLCKCMALELAPHGILVNEIAPGYVEAGLSAAIWKTNPQLSEQARQRVPLKKLITADEVAGQILTICAPENVHMTGSTILMDGGLSLLT
jgi:glucose 1-dehydrogenase